MEKKSIVKESAPVKRYITNNQFIRVCASVTGGLPRGDSERRTRTNKALREHTSLKLCSSHVGMHKTAWGNPLLLKQRQSHRFSLKRSDSHAAQQSLQCPHLKQPVGSVGLPPGRTGTGTAATRGVVEGRAR